MEPTHQPIRMTAQWASRLRGESEIEDLPTRHASVSRLAGEQQEHSSELNHLNAMECPPEGMQPSCREWGTLQGETGNAKIGPMSGATK